MLPKHNIRMMGGPLDGEVHQMEFTAGRWGFVYKKDFFHGEYNYPGPEENTMIWTEYGQQG